MVRRQSSASGQDRSVVGPVHLSETGHRSMTAHNVCTAEKGQRMEHAAEADQYIGPCTITSPLVGALVCLKFSKHLRD